MSEADDIDELRAKKREELLQQDDTPTTPVPVEDTGHFEELRSNHRLLLVDFYADWCGPCDVLEPTVAAVAEETEAAVATIDIDAHRDIARQYQVRGVPTLLLFDDGQPVDRMVGVQDKGTLLETIRTQS
jgi:thioredoxin 1